MSQHDVPSPEDYRQFHTRGYFIARGVADREQVAAIRAALLRRAEAVAASGAYANDQLLEQGAQGDPEAVPLHRRFRKLNRLQDVPELWHGWLANPRVLAYLRGFLGEDILDKYASAFLKPAHVGGATPWHQDIGLWGDTNSGAMNGWLAIDPATVENGCLQVVPGSHAGPVVEHVSYPDSIHPELPRERCREVRLDHIELEPGDCVLWHSHLWHASPPNRSDRDRIGVGGVWVEPGMIGELTGVRRLRWAMRGGEVLAHPAPELIVAQDVEPAAV